MSYPNRGCYTCRRRRIKCDGLRPVCARCSGSGRICAGFPPDSLIFVNENSFAKGKPRRPRGYQKSEVDMVTPQSSRFPSIKQGFHVALDSQAFSYLMHDHLAVPYTEWKVIYNHLCYVEPFWSQSNPGSALRLAVSALSYAVFGRVKRVPESISAGISVHRKAIDAAARALRGQETEPAEHSILTILLLRSYENTVHGERVSKPNEVLNSHSSGSSQSGELLQAPRSIGHYEGVLYIISQQIEKKELTEDNLEFYRSLRRQLMQECLLFSKSAPEWMRDGTRFGEYTRTVLFEKILVVTSELSDRCKRQLNADTPSFEYENSLHALDLRQIADQAKYLDGQLTEWVSNKGVEWGFQRCPLPIHGDDGPDYQPPVARLYIDDAHAAMWGRWAGARMLLNSTRIKALEEHCRFSEPYDLASLDEAQKIVDDMTDAICASIPFHFSHLTIKDNHGTISNGAFNSTFEVSQIPSYAAFWWTWPMSAAVLSAGVSPSKKRWLREQLKVAGQVLGDGSLQSMAAEQT